MGCFKINLDWQRFVGFGFGFSYGQWNLYLPGIGVSYNPKGSGYWLFGKYVQGSKSE